MSRLQDIKHFVLSGEPKWARVFH